MTQNRPQVPTELQILTVLHTRMNFSSNNRSTYNNLTKGYKGEQSFYKLVEKELTADCLMLFDLLLESNKIEFQIDSLLLFEQELYLIEVKNFDGDFYVKKDKWFAVASGNEIRNPFLQLQRSEFLLRQLLEQIGFTFPVKSHLVFVNPEFTLYQAPFEKSIVFPGQLRRFIKKLNRLPSRLSEEHHRLADELIRRHKVTSNHERLPEYDYTQLKKGLVCSACRGFLSVLTLAELRCRKCGQTECVETAVMRAVAEFHLLFPEKPITTSAIYEWSKIISSKKRIRRILMKNMELIRKGKYSHYIFFNR